MKSDDSKIVCIKGKVDEKTIIEMINKTSEQEDIIHFLKEQVKDLCKVIENLEYQLKRKN